MLSVLSSIDDCDRALVYVHSYWCSDLSSAGVRHSRLALGLVVCANVLLFVLALMQELVQLRTRSFLPADSISARGETQAVTPLHVT